MGINERDVISHSQAIDAGLTRSSIAANLKHGRWQRLHRGVYVTHNGPISRETRLSAALVAAGPDAVASHWTAATLAGIAEPISTIHLAVPKERRVMPLTGVRVHYSSRLPEAAHPTRLPSQTRVEETVLDLVDVTDREDAVVAWLASACGRRVTTAARIAVAMDSRKRCRWRRLVSEALGDIGAGTQSVLERRYLRDVERAHRLPAGRRQEPHERSGGRIYDDIWYASWGTVVELDGRIAHPIEATVRDLRRDNIAVLRGDSVLHFDWSDVARTPCLTASQVATVLRQRGWLGRPTACGSTCVFAEDRPRPSRSAYRG